MIAVTELVRAPLLATDAVVLVILSETVGHPSNVVNIYKELQDLKSKSTPREAHSLDISDLDPELENYLVSTSRLALDSPDTALLDSATTHSILRHPDYFQFKHSDFPWQTCELTTIAGKRNLKFKEGRTKLLLPRGTSITLAQAMYAPAAPRNLISYKDLQAQDVHLTTEGVQGEEAIKLRRRGDTLATATAGTTGLYSIKVCPPTDCAPLRQESAFTVTSFEPQKAIEGDDPAFRLQQDFVPARLLRDPDPAAGSKLQRLSTMTKANLGRKARVLSDASNCRQCPHSGPAVANWGTNIQAVDAVFVGDTPTKSGLWYGRLGHLSATMLRRMIPILEGHPLCTRDAEHTGRCSACAQRKFSISASQWKLPNEGGGEGGGEGGREGGRKGGREEGRKGGREGGRKGGEGERGEEERGRGGERERRREGEGGGGEGERGRGGEKERGRGGEREATYQ